MLARLREAGLPASYVYLLEAKGVRPISRASVPRPRRMPRPLGLDGLDLTVGAVDGISVNKQMILAPDRLGRATGPSPVVADAHERGFRCSPGRAAPRTHSSWASSAALGGKAAFGDSEAEWTIIRDSGVDGVFVDHTDLGVAFFRDRA